MLCMGVGWCDILTLSLSLSLSPSLSLPFSPPPPPPSPSLIFNAVDKDGNGKLELSDILGSYVVF
jgi:hypothetical protein